MGKKISELTAASSLGATDKLEVETATPASKNVTGQMILDYIRANVGLPDVIAHNNTMVDGSKITSVDLTRSLTLGNLLLLLEVIQADYDNYIDVGGDYVEIYSSQTAVGSGQIYVGPTVIGITSSTEIVLIAPKIKLATLPTIYANNAAAIGGGLIAGEIYRTGANPDVLCIVH